MTYCVYLSIQKKALLELNKYFGLKKMKKGEPLPLIESPTIYLGGKLSQVELPNSVVAWAVSSSQYMQEAACDISPVISAEDGN